MVRFLLEHGASVTAVTKVTEPLCHHHQPHYYPHGLCWSASVGCSSPSVCLFVCLFVSPEHNSTANDPKVFKLGIENDLWIP